MKEDRQVDKGNKKTDKLTKKGQASGHRQETKRHTNEQNMET